MDYVVKTEKGYLRTSDKTLMIYEDRIQANHHAEVSGGEVEEYIPILAHQFFGIAGGDVLMVEYAPDGSIFRIVEGGDPKGKGPRLPSFITNKETFNTMMRHAE